MAKYERRLYGDFKQILADIDEEVMGNLSASLEDQSNLAVKGCRCAVRVYERYSLAGGNRVSLSVTLVETGEGIYLSAITAGGSTAMFFKMNTLGETAFLEKMDVIIQKYGDKD